MGIVSVNGVDLNVEEMGSGDPAVFIHGAWVDHHTWDSAAGALASTSRVITYDRRGHSGSGNGAAPGRIDDDVADLAALIEELGIAPALVVGNSFGALIALRLSMSRPELIRGLAVHEPPATALLADDPAAAEALSRIGAVIELIAEGKNEDAAERFFDTVAIGEGAWMHFPPELRALIVRNAPTFLEEGAEPSAFWLDLDRLGAYHGPALLTHGDQSPPMFLRLVGLISDAVPTLTVRTLAGAGHIPQETNTDDYVATLREFFAHVLA